MQLIIAQLILVSLSFVSLTYSAPVPSPEVPADSIPRIEFWRREPEINRPSWRREPEINRPSWRRSPTSELPGAEDLVQKRGDVGASEAEEAQKVVVESKAKTGFPTWSAVVPPNRVNRNPDYILL